MSGIIKPYQFPKRRVKRVSPKAPAILKEPKKEFTLSGFVQGKTASDNEEWFAAALYEHPYVMGFEFRVAAIAGRNLPGEIEIDFLVDVGVTYPVQIDGDFVHKSSSQKTQDTKNDAILNRYLAGTCQNVIRIDASTWKGIDDARRATKEYL